MNKLSEEPLDLSLHPAGINTVQKETSLGEKVLRDSVNFDISSDGKKKVRPGYTQIYSGANIHSLSKEDISLGPFFVENGKLKKLNPDYTTLDIVDVNPSKIYRMEYVQVDNKVYYTNGFDSGIVKDNVAYTWGVPTPESAPIYSLNEGSLGTGTYYLKYTYVRDEEESGATDYAKVVITSPSKITLYNIPSNIDADFIRVYSTKKDGSTFYKQQDIPVSFSTYDIVFIDDGIELETDNMYNNPIGHLVTRFNGRIYWANNSRLYWTEALRYGLYHYDNFITFPERITIVLEVDNGIFVVADKTYFLGGEEPKDFNRKVVYPHRAIEGTHQKLFYNVFNIDDYFGDTVCWVSTEGMVLGQKSGTVKPLTEKRYALDKYTHGASTFFEQDGIRKLITALQNKGGSSSFRASDKVTATVIRANGTIE